MIYMKWLKGVVWLCLFLCVPLSNVLAETVQDPFSDYLSRTAYNPDDHILSFVVNFGEDKKYVFVSLGSLVNGKAGNIWEPYAANANTGYEPLNEPISLRKDALAFATVEGLEGKALVTYWPESAERGLLRAFQIDKRKLITHDIGEIEPLGKDQEIYSQLFSNETNSLIVLDQPVSEVLSVSEAQKIPTGDQSYQPLPRRETIGKAQPSGSPSSQLTMNDVSSSNSEEDLSRTKRVPWLILLATAFVICGLYYGWLAKSNPSR